MQLFVFTRHSLRWVVVCFLLCTFTACLNTSRAPITVIPTGSSSSLVSSSAPAITSVSPSGGTTIGGTALTLSGSGFVLGATIQVGASSCSSVIFVSANVLRCTTTSHSAAQVNVVVTNPDGKSGTLAGGFTYQGTPVVTSISPNAGTYLGGTSITITGTGFLSGATVRIGSSSCTSVTVSSSTKTTCTTPSGTANSLANVVVTNTDNQAGTLTNGFSFVVPAVVSAISPARGPIGGATSVTITGSGFTGTPTVQLGSTSCTSVSVASSTSLTCTTGAASAATVDVSVTNTGSAPGTLKSGFTYDPAPTVTAISPSGGTTSGSTSVTITGTGFWGSPTVSVASATCSSPSVVSSTSITCTTGAGSTGTGNVVVTNSDSQAGTLTSGYTYYTLHAATPISPTSGPASGGTTLTINASAASSFLATPTVTVGGNTCTSVSLVSSSQLTCTTPAGTAGSAAVVVTNPSSASVTSGTNFTYNPGPTVSSISSSVGKISGSTSVTLSGSNFSTATAPTVQMRDPDDASGASCALTANSATSITCTTSYHFPGVVDVIVTNGTDSQKGSLVSGFTYDYGYWPSTVTTTSAPSARLRNTAVWTGSKMLIWGGYDVSTTVLSTTGGSYDPATNSWTALSTTSQPTARYLHSAIWDTASSKMAIWGGSTSVTGTYVNTGGRYDPATDSWETITTTSAPSARGYHTAIWDTASSTMIIWGGYSGSAALNSGKTYNAASASPWSAYDLSTSSGVPSIRFNHTALWDSASSVMAVWGGYDLTSALNTGARYQSSTNAWTTITTTGAPSARLNHTAVFDTTSAKMIIWGGYAGESPLNTGGVFDATGGATGAWNSTRPPTPALPSARSDATIVITGTKLIVWGGYDGKTALNTGGVYDYANNSWSTTTTTGAPSIRRYHSALWTGSRMLIWGGYNESSWVNTGGLYDPSADSWITITTTGAPAVRAEHSFVWTGTTFIVWGGFAGSTNYLDSGGVYTVSTDTWSATQTTSRPTARKRASAVWTGSAMIIWGGYSGSSYLNTGSSYDPTANSWTALTTTSAPVARGYHTAVWDTSSSAMIIWGGFDGSAVLNTGGTYTPSTTSWAATNTSSTNVPSARYLHTAVWDSSSSMMAVWGGFDLTTTLNSGARYKPSSSEWIGMTTTNAPSARMLHAATYDSANSKMIIWGGNTGDSLLNTGALFDATGGTTGSWSTSQASYVPTARYRHTAVWTGKMVVFGGYTINGTYTNSGAVYDQASNYWQPTATSSAPAARAFHSTVWTGSKMIIWGGFNGSSVLNTGSVYETAP